MATLLEEKEIDLEELAGQITNLLKGHPDRFLYFQEIAQVLYDRPVINGKITTDAVEVRKALEWLSSRPPSDKKRAKAKDSFVFIFDGKGEVCFKQNPKTLSKENN